MKKPHSKRSRRARSFNGLKCLGSCLLLLPLPLGGCNSEDSPLSRSQTQTRALQQPGQELMQLRAQLSQVKAHYFQELEPLSEKLMSCARFEPPFSSSSSYELWVRLDDTRGEAKHLLPLALTEQLASTELSRIERQLLDRAKPGVEPSLRGSELKRALRRLEALEKRQYLLALFVTRFSQPRLVLKKGKLRREWIGGYIAATLVIYRLRDGKPLCSDTVLVTNDGLGLPTKARLRDETRKRLVNALGHGVRAQVSALLKARRWSLPEAWQLRDADTGKH